MKANLVPCMADPIGAVGSVELIAYNQSDPTVPDLTDKESMVIQHALHILRSKQPVVGSESD